MPPRYDEAPEVAPSTGLPEVHHPSTAPEFNPYAQQPPQQYPSPVAQYPKPEGSTLQGTYTPINPTVSNIGYDHSSPRGGAYSDTSRARESTVCGCSLLVFILSTIIALLSVAVIGLAAGTGVEASRANAMSAGNAIATTTITASASTSTSADFNTLDRNCTSNSAQVSGTNYTSFFFNSPSYRIWCNKDTPNSPLMSLFVGNIDDCMDACSSYTAQMPNNFANGTAQNQTCSAISFIPAWTNRTFADSGTAPGNCYLKPGPQTKTGLSAPNVGSEVHAAILNP